MANQPVASSSSPPYHVFLSFRGVDTRTNFTDDLYNALVDKEIKTFIDNDLPRGEAISPSLLEAIEESRISVVILSKNYADSRWCLEELVKIHQCKESKQQIILPVFYKVDPSDVRHQTGCYGDAFIGHERKFEDKEMVLMWRRAFTAVGNLAGCHVKKEDSEDTKISNIVKDIEPSSRFAQFQVERANSGDHQNNHYLHIKCLYNNKYWRRMDTNSLLILAAAHDRDENTDRWTCTLFKPERVGPTGNNPNKVPCRLRHVATGLYTEPFVDNKLELRLGEENPDPQEVDVYTAIGTHMI